VLFLFIQYLYYLSNYDLPSSLDPPYKLKQYLFALCEFGSVLVLSLVLSVVALVLHLARLVHTDTLLSYGRGVGILSAVIVFFHWTPQLVTTFRLSKAGSLSLPMLGIQCPGAFLVVGFHLSTNKPDWSTWAPMLVAGTEQVILIVMLVYFVVRDRIWRKKKEEAEAEKVTFLDERIGTLN